jgi:hypothetical protein
MGGVQKGKFVPEVEGDKGRRSTVPREAEGGIKGDDGRVSPGSSGNGDRVRQEHIVLVASHR